MTAENIEVLSARRSSENDLGAHNCEPFTCLQDSSEILSTLLRKGGPDLLPQRSLVFQRIPGKSVLCLSFAVTDVYGNSSQRQFQSLSRSECQVGDNKILWSHSRYICSVLSETLGSG